MSKAVPLVPLGDILKPVSRPERVDPEKVYRILGAHWYAEGLYVKDTLPGSEIRADKVFRVEEGDFVYNRLFAWKGSFAVASDTNDGCYVSNEFPCFEIDKATPDTRPRRRALQEDPRLVPALFFVPIRHSCGDISAGHPLGTKH
jgi:hypothetical protein